MRHFSETVDTSELFEIVGGEYSGGVADISSVSLTADTVENVRPCLEKKKKSEVRPNIPHYLVFRIDKVK